MFAWLAYIGLTGVTLIWLPREQYIIFTQLNSLPSPVLRQDLISPYGLLYCCSIMNISKQFSLPSPLGGVLSFCLHLSPFLFCLPYTPLKCGVAAIFVPTQILAISIVVHICRKSGNCPVALVVKDNTRLLLSTARPMNSFFFFFVTLWPAKPALIVIKRDLTGLGQYF